MRVIFNSGGHPLVRFEPSTCPGGLEIVTQAEGAPNMHTFPIVQENDAPSDIEDPAELPWSAGREDRRSNIYAITREVLGDPYAVTSEHTVWRLRIWPLTVYFQGSVSVVTATITIRRLHSDHSWHIEVYDKRVSVEVPLEGVTFGFVSPTEGHLIRYEREDVL